MNHFFKRSLAQLLTTLLLAHYAHAAFPANGDFEAGLDWWVLGDDMSQASEQAAHSGKLGLLVVDEDTQHGSNLYSSTYPASPGDDITLSFDAKADGDFMAVYLYPQDAQGKRIKIPKGSAKSNVPIKKGDGEWQHYSLTVTMPENTAAVSFWVHSWSTSQGTAYLDNFKLTGIAPDAEPLQTLAQMQAATEKAMQKHHRLMAKQEQQEAVPDTLPERAKPPVIILKLDDLKQVNGSAHSSWTRVTDYLANKGIKSSIGVITETLQDATPAYKEWILERRDSGMVEFWFHGWDHQVRKDESGTKRSEFLGRPLDEQLKRFADSQQLANEKLGFQFTTFGPGGGGKGGHQDASTAQAMEQDPSMKVWLYPSPIDDMGREVAANNKVTILDRVWAVNIEGSVGQPNYNRFVSGYAKNPDREYFVLQGHPTHWGGERFDEFEQIIDFLIEQNAVFMTPSEYAASLDGQPAQQVAKR